MLNTTGTGTRWNKKNDFRIVRRDEKRVLGFGSFLRAEKLMNLYITHLGRTWWWGGEVVSGVPRVPPFRSPETSGSFCFTSASVEACLV